MKYDFVRSHESDIRIEKVNESCVFMAQSASCTSPQQRTQREESNVRYSRPMVDVTVSFQYLK